MIEDFGECPKCGAKLTVFGQAFCPLCGEPLSEGKAAKAKRLALAEAKANYDAAVAEIEAKTFVEAVEVEPEVDDAA